MQPPVPTLAVLALAVLAAASTLSRQMPSPMCSKRSGQPLPGPDFANPFLPTLAYK
jgi:hypothetical protein